MRSKTAKEIKARYIAFILFIVIVPISAHFLFSWMGFNPTDDGFTLAYSRRILEGQVPHRDFIIIRPFISPLMHTPFVLLGGDYTFWISRLFVWFQIALISWIWTCIIDQFLREPFSIIEKPLIALIAFAFSSNCFPIMAWHTIDGLFLSSIGLFICLKERKSSKLIGYALIGAAYLCKQSYILMAPMVIITLGDWRKIKYWIAICMPGIIYLFYLYSFGAIPDAVLQLGSQSRIVSVGFKSYITKWMTLLGIVAGYFLMRISIGYPELRTTINRLKPIALSMLYGIPTLGATICLGLSGRISLTGLYSLFSTSFGLFGMVMGVTLYFFVENVKESRRQIQAGLLVLVAAWSVSISLGYNSPVLASGILVALLIAYACSFSQPLKRSTRLFIILFTTIIVTFSFITARHNFIYREKSKSYLTQPIDGLLPGGKLIKTNINTYEFLGDLKNAINIAGYYDMSYAIIPDLAGYWVKSTQVNPLPIDWAQGTELNQQELVDRVIRSLKNQRGDIIILVQKVNASTLAAGFVPIPDNDYFAIVRYVRTNFIEFNQTEFFDLYR